MGKGEVGGGGGCFQMVLLEKHRERVRFVRFERQVPHVGLACNFIQICRVKRLLLALLMDDRWYGRGWSHQQRDRGFSSLRGIIDENQKKNRAQNTALRNASLDRKRG